MKLPLFCRPQRATQRWPLGAVLPFLGCPLLFLAVAGNLSAQSKSGGAKPPIPTVEAGLEDAVKWRWRIEPGEPSKWGIPIVLATPSTPSTASGTATNSSTSATPIRPPQPLGPPEQPLVHEVTRGDTLTVIARRYGVGVDHLKKANEMTSDLIRIGQKLQVPSRAQILAMAPPPPPETKPAEGAQPTVSVKPPVEETRPAIIVPKYTRPLNGEAQRSSHVTLTQSFLSRKLFSCGPIDGADGGLYQSAIAAYRAAYPGELDYSAGETPAVLRALGGAYREYTLRPEDYRWIAPGASGTSSNRSTPRGQTARDPDPDWKALTTGDFLAYRSAWEFVAERFHCSESFLRRLNSSIKSTPKPGTLFLVPNVEPFEIDNIFDDPIQPEVPPDEPVVAKIINNAWLEVWHGDQLKARVPVSAARPGLRGRGTWKILKAMPHPRLVCTGEWSSPPKVAEIGLSNAEVILKPPPYNAVIPPGPNNPLGPLWIDLAKSGETEPLPYGLHGTSIPGYLTRQESLGGFRLTNWDLARIVRLLPAGTDLKWE